MVRRRRFGFGWIALALALVMFVSACGSDSKSSSQIPTAPSTPTTTTGSGNNNGNNNNSNNTNNSTPGAVVTGIVTSASSTQSARTSGGRIADVAGVSRVEVVGTTIASTVDGQGNFSLTGVPAGTAQLKFTGTSVSATTTVSDLQANQTVSVIVTVSGSGAAVVSDSRNPDAGQLNVAGNVDSLGGTATAFQFVLNGYTIHGDAQTQFSSSDGSQSTSFDDLKNGLRVEVKATPRDGGLYAFRLQITKANNPTPTPTPAPTPTPTPPPTPTPSSDIETDGTASGVKGSCPSLTFTVNGYSVITNGSTLFDGFACGDVRDGRAVLVNGTKQANGSVLATRIRRG
jgi:hypothetical protein